MISERSDFNHDKKMSGVQKLPKDLNLIKFNAENMLNMKSCKNA